MSEREILFRGQTRRKGEKVRISGEPVDSNSGKKCLFPDCETITNSKYGLCAKHYRRQWDRLKKGAISDMHDFSQSKRKLSDETKEKLRECAIKQRRINGKFASNVYDNPELLKGE